MTRRLIINDLSGELQEVEQFDAAAYPGWTDRGDIPAEIPLGIVTAIVGAGTFLGLMATGRREHGG